MPDLISPDTVQVASALLEQIDSTHGSLLTDQQKRNFRSLRDITDRDEKISRTKSLMAQLIADAKATVDGGREVVEQTAELERQFSPEAQQEIKNSVSAFESRLRTEAQAELRSLAGTQAPSGQRRPRMRI